MLSVDVVYESEILPRLVLLKQHMQALHVDLILHEQLPATHSARVVYAPRAKNSLLQVEDDSSESIGLYFNATNDSRHTRLSTDLAVSLPTWPARSSDQAVAEFARYLKRPIAARQTRTTTDAPGDPGVGRSIDWAGVRNLTILISLVVAATWLIEQVPEQPPDEAGLVENHPPPGSKPHPQIQTEIAGTTDGAERSGELARSTEATRAVSDRRSAPGRHPQCTPSQAHVLDAILTLQAPTDFAACLKQPKPLKQRRPVPTPAPESDSSTRTTKRAHSQPAEPA